MPHSLLAAVGAGPQAELTLLGVLAAVAAILVLAHRLHVPYPILLVVGGAAIGYTPGVPSIALDPDVVLVVFLPPLLYGAAFFSSPRELGRNARSIGLLAIGGVVVTLVVVAGVAHTVIGGLPWGAAFVLGAVLAPTDPTAATSIASRAGAPRRFVTVVEGESLINDAAALIAYEFAVAAAVSGRFSALDAAGSFVLDAVAGVAIGIVVAELVRRVRGWVRDDGTEVVLSVLTGFFAYLPAAALGVSGVLAAVTAGLTLAWHSPGLMAPTTRIASYSFWQVLTYLLNAALFLLVGLQLPAITSAVAGDDGVLQLTGYALAVTAAMVLARFAWVFPVSYVPRAIMPSLRRRDPISWHLPFLTSFCGMRGGLSLATALAIPLATDAGRAFPQRDLLVFLAYVAILASLVGEGLLLGPLIGALGLRDTEDDGPPEARARRGAARAALSRIDELQAGGEVREETATRMRDLFEFRAQRMESRLDPDGDTDHEERSQAYQRGLREVLEAQRLEIVRLRDAGEISEEVMMRLERELDLEDARLEI